MPRKKTKKQIREEERANFVPYRTEFDEDTWLWHFYDYSIKVVKIPPTLTPEDMLPLLKLANFILECPEFADDEQVKAFKKKYPNH